MTPFHLEREFAGTLDAFWKVYFDPSCVEATYAAVGVKAWELVELRDEGDRMIRTIHAVPSRELPAFVRALTGASLGYTETTTIYRAENRGEVVVEPDTLGARCDIRGNYAVEPLGDDRLRRSFAGHVHIDVAVVGRRIERVVLDDLSRSFDAGGDVTQRWLDRAG